MASYLLVTYQSEKGPRAGVVVDEKVFDAAALTRKASYATMLDILNDWKTAQGLIRKAAAGKSKLKSRPLARTKLQVWLNFIATEIQMGCFCPLFHPTTSEQGRAMYRERLGSRLAHVDRHLTKSTYMLGERFSLADAYLFVASNWSRAAKVDLSPYPLILALRKRVGARPAVQATLCAEGLT